MAKKDALFRLIKSLDKNEKRSFRMFASLGGKNKNYLKLFDAISAQELYDEAALKRRFKEETFVKQLHVTKNYLRKLILRSLRIHHHRLSVAGQIRDLLRDTEILFRKELYDLSQVSLNKAEALANEYEKLAILPDIHSWKRKLILSRGGLGSGRKEIAALLEEEKDALALLQKKNFYWKRIIHLFDNEAPLAHESDKRISENDSDPVSLRLLAGHLQQSRHFLEGNIEAALESVRELAKMLEARPHLIREDPGTYLTVLNNYIGNLLQLRRHREIPPLLQRIRAIPKTYGINPKSGLSLRMNLQSFNVELEIYRDLGQIDQGIQRAPAVLAYLESFGHLAPASYSLLLLYQICHLYFVGENYREALKNINRIMLLKGDGLREDIISYSRLLNLMIHYELGNMMVLKYGVVSTRRFLKKKRTLYDFERRLLIFFSQISIQPRGNHGDLFQELQKNLFAGTPDAVRKNALDYLDFEAWIDRHSPLKTNPAL